MKNKVIALLIILVVMPLIINAFNQKMHEGLSIESKSYDGDVVFLHDLTYMKDNKYTKEQNIFEEQLRVIRNAEKFILIDMFLYNSEYDTTGNVQYPTVSNILTEELIKKKKSNPKIDIVFITDEINNFYGVYEDPNIKRLRDNDIDVVITNMLKLPDSNYVYSSYWKNYIKWFGVGSKGKMINPFNVHGQRVTLRGYLKLLNFKANHRKNLITEKEAIVTSMNPHDASANHSNIGFLIKGEVIKDMIQSELQVARLSGYDKEVDFQYIQQPPVSNCQVSFITEGKIKDVLIKDIESTNEGDSIDIGMFYLSNRHVIKSLIKASERNVKIRLVLDSNKDAFGRQKNGIPNRQVAYELKDKANNIEIRWYDTHGEQFHTKLICINKDGETTIIGGSANLTRRNIGDYNLESNVKVVVDNESVMNKQVKDYFNRIWDNKDGKYTLDYKKFEENSFLKTMIYRFQEWSGLSTY